MSLDSRCDKYGWVLVETGGKMCSFSQSNYHIDKHFAGLLAELIFSVKYVTPSKEHIHNF